MTARQKPLNADGANREEWVDMNAREGELVVRTLLENPALVDIYLKETLGGIWLLLVRFAKRDVPVSLAQSDPAL